MPLRPAETIVERVNRELNAALGRAGVRERLALHAFEPLTTSAAELAAFIKDQQGVWANAVRELGLPVQ